MGSLRHDELFVDVGKCVLLVLEDVLFVCKLCELVEGVCERKYL